MTKTIPIGGGTSESTGVCQRAAALVYDQPGAAGPLNGTAAAEKRGSYPSKTKEVMPRLSSPRLSGDAQLIAVSLLNEQLRDAIQVWRQAKQARANAVFRLFGCKTSFDEVARCFDVIVRYIAACIAELGGAAQESIMILDSDPPSVGDFVDAFSITDAVLRLSIRIREFARSIRAAIATAIATGDVTTANDFSRLSSVLPGSL